MIAAFQVHPADNVATVLGDVSDEAVTILGGAQPVTLHTVGAAQMGHKVALRDIVEGGAVIKFGVEIGVATRDIRRGEWVHLQNCRSRVDERSAAFDAATGAATDTAYE